MTSSTTNLIPEESGTKCTYDVPWVGDCGDPAIESNPPRCGDHAGRTCWECGDPATHGCPQTAGLVCGRPLCDDCSCETHLGPRA